MSRSVCICVSAGPGGRVCQLKFQGARSRKGKRCVKSAFQWGRRKILPLMVPEGESRRRSMRFSTASHISRAKTTLGGWVSTVGGGIFVLCSTDGKNQRLAAADWWKRKW